MRRYFSRNIAARDHLELFLVSAASSLLLLRFLLFEAGYPQVGGSSLHIAHMLYGGLLMLAAIVIMLSFIGLRIQRLAAVVGGVGFGVFIDELGKFITKDNNYFFRPTVGIIYAIFAILYLAFNFISRRQSYSSQEYQLNALQLLGAVIVKDMDRYEKAAVRKLLAKADQDSPITQELQGLLKRIQPAQAAGSRRQRAQEKAARIYAQFWRRRRSNHLVAAVFGVVALVFLAAIIANMASSFASIRDLLHGADSYSAKLLIGQLAATVVAAAFTAVGIIKLFTSRLEAFEYFHRAVMVNLLLTEFFIFSRVQFHAIPSFVLNLLLLAGLRAAAHQEHRVLQP